MRKRILPMILTLCMVLTPVSNTIALGKNHTDVDILKSTGDAINTRETNTQKEESQNNTNSVSRKLSEPANNTKSAVLADDAPTSGACGENAAWRLEDDTLIISGTGWMSDDDDVTALYPQYPWSPLQEKIKHIEIESGITSIGDYAFYDCINLIDINIPNGVTRIGDYAFQNCYNLTGVRIPDSVISIGEGAFVSCSSLFSIIIPDNVIGIGEDAFYECNSLTSISIPDGVSSIRYETFYFCGSLTSISIPSSVTSIEEGAFRACARLSDVYYAGDEASWENLEIENYNDQLTDATIHYNGTASDHGPCIIRKEAEPRKLKDGNTVKDLYEIIVKDNGIKRRFSVNGVAANMPDYMPCFLAVDGSHFCATKKQSGVLPPKIIEGTVDGSDLEVLFDEAGSSDYGYFLRGSASYCDLYAKAKDGKPISGLYLEYDASQHGDMMGGIADMILYDENGNIKNRMKLDGCGTVTSRRGQNGYTQLTTWGSDPIINQSGQFTPYIGGAVGFTRAYAILDDSGKEYENSYGEGNRFIRAFKTNGSEDKFTVLAPDGEKVADVIIHAHETDYYSTSATDFDYDYEVENLADGWEILVDMSETTAFPNNIKTGEALPCEPSLLISITAKRKNDDGLIPTTYDFDGRQKLKFQFKGIDGIKEIRKVYFTCAENLREADSDWVGWFSYSTEDIKYDFKKGELTIPSISEWVYDKSPSVGNTYQGCMTYVTEDGTEKTAYGDWYIKVLEKSDQPIPDDTDNDSQKPADTPNDKPGSGDAKPGNPNAGNPAAVKVSEIRLSGLSHKIAVGKKVALQATVTPPNAADKSIDWKSSNTKYATVNSKGVVSIKKAGAGKTVTITATAGDGSGKQASYKIKCMKGVVKKVAISGQKSLSLKPGKSIKLKAKVTASSKANKTLHWTSSNPKYASVTNKGKVTAKKAGKGKTVKITAMATDGSGKKASAKIRIK